MLPSKSADALQAPPRTLRARIPEPRGAVSKGPPRLARLLAARPFSQNNRCRGRSRSYNGSRMSISRKAIWLAAGVLCLTAAAFAQRFGRGGFGGFGGFGGGRSEAPESEFSPNAEFQDRKSTRLNSSHPSISYAVFCLKKKKFTNRRYIQ